MATSGRIGQIELPLQEILDAAFRACRLVPQNVTPEMLHNGKKALQRMLNALPARAIPLWARDHLLLPFTVGKRAMVLPVGTIDVVSAHVRTYSRLEATLTSDGTIQTYTLPGETTVAAIGLKPAYTAQWTLTLQATTDNENWFTIWSPGQAEYPGGQRTWIEMDPLVQAKAIRLQGVVDTDLEDLAICASPRDREITRMNHDDYVAIASLTSTSIPHQYWLDRQAAAPEMRFWPLPGVQTDLSVLSLWRQRHIEDVGSMTQSLEIPARWESPIIKALAWEIAIDTPQVDISIVNMLKPLADEYLALIAADERDASPIRFRAALRGYTR